MVIIPEVKHIKLGEKVFDRPESFNIDFKGMERVKKYVLSFLKVSEEAKNKIIFNENKALAEEEYNLFIDEDIKVEYSFEVGAFRAMSTLKQILAEDKITSGEYNDSPDLKARGIMLDIGRGKIPKVKVLCDYIDLMADIKFNKFELYIDSPVFDYAHFKDITKDYEPLTIEEFLEVKKYADDKFVTMVPNQNSFGHMMSWLKTEQFAPLGITRDDGKDMDTLNPLDPKSLEFVDTLYSDMLPYFDADTVNIGSDETTSIGMGQTKEACEKTSKTDVYIDYLNKLINLVNTKYHKTPMFWDDIVFVHPEKLDRIDKNCIVLDWAYEGEADYVQRAQVLKEKGLRFYTCPGTSCWGTLTGRLENALCNIEEAARAAVLCGGEGLLVTDWGDNGNPNFPPFSFISYVFGACCAWNYNIGPQNNRERHIISHTSYRKERTIVDFIEQYIDKFIFGVKGMGGALRRLGNIYLLESPLKFNSGHVYTNIFWPYPNGKKFYLQKEDVENIRDNLTMRIAELENFPKDTKYLEEIMFDAKLLRTCAEYYLGSLLGKHEPKLKDRLTEAKRDFERLWTKSNHKHGSELFINRIQFVIDNMIV